MIWRDERTPLTIEQSAARKQVYKQISTDPESFSMRQWERVPVIEIEGPWCATTRCVAGWAQYYAHGYVDVASVDQDAVTALGLTWGEYISGDLRAMGLFHCPDKTALAAMKRLAEVEPGDACP